MDEPPVSAELILFRLLQLQLPQLAGSPALPALWIQQPLRRSADPDAQLLQQPVVAPYRRNMPLPLELFQCQVHFAHSGPAHRGSATRAWQNDELQCLHWTGEQCDWAMMVWLVGRKTQLHWTRMPDGHLWLNFRSAAQHHCEPPQPPHKQPWLPQSADVHYLSPPESARDIASRHAVLQVAGSGWRWFLLRPLDHCAAISHCSAEVLRRHQ